MSIPNLAKLDLSDSDNDSLFASPSKPSRGPRAPIKQPATASPTETRFDAEATREAALQRELEGVRNINNVISGVITSLETARGHMGTVSQTVGSASTLLETWTRILSQTEHNQRLILNPNWQGASRDLVEIENEAVMRVQAEERRKAEEERRREEAKRKAEDEERSRQAGTVTPSMRGTRGRGRVSRVTRGTVSTRGTGYVGVGGQGGRGIPPPRVRGTRGRGT